MEIGTKNSEWNHKMLFNSYFREGLRQDICFYSACSLSIFSRAHWSLLASVLKLHSWVKHFLRLSIWDFMLSCCSL